METLIIIAILSFGGGYWTGHENSTVTCQNDPLITSSCPEPQPPADRTFGATTASYVDLIGTYRKCRAACLPK